VVCGGDIPSMSQLDVGTLFPPPVDELAVAGAGGWSIFGEKMHRCCSDKHLCEKQCQSRL